MGAFPLRGHGSELVQSKVGSNEGGRSSGTQALRGLTRDAECGLQEGRDLEVLDRRF